MAVVLSMIGETIVIDSNNKDDNENNIARYWQSRKR